MPTGVYERPLSIANTEQSTVGKEQPDMIGRKFGRLLILNYDKEISKLKRCDCYLVRCNCGVEKVIKGRYLRDRRTRSCGCLRQEVSSQTGENSNQYLFGLCTKERAKFRESIRRRDNYECQRCGKTQEQELKITGKKLHVHHKDNDHYNDVPENATTLCRLCHAIVRGIK